MTRRRVYTFVALAALLAGAGFWRWRARTTSAAPRFETAEVDRGHIVAKVTATGTLSAIVTVTVGSQVSGRIQALYADYNSRVTKGQLIAKIDPQSQEAAVEEARANLMAAEGTLAKYKAQAADAKRTFERYKLLVNDKLIAQSDYDTAQSTYEADVAQIKAQEGSVAQTRAALNSAKVNLANTRIYSPINGIVISRSVDVGQTVAASMSTPTLFTVAEDLSKMQVDSNVSEADVGRLRDGMDATFTVDAYPGESFTGRVRQIRNAATTTSNVVTYDAVLDVANPELKLRPGMTANVTFVYAEREDALRVSNAALRFRPSAGLSARAERPTPPTGSQPPLQAQRSEKAQPSPKPTGKSVWVLGPEGPHPVRVRTGITDGSFTEILDPALEVGTRVITEEKSATGSKATKSTSRDQGPPGGGPPGGGPPPGGGGMMRRL